MTEEKPIKNFLYTKGYFISRLRSAGFLVKKLKIDYNSVDKRYWSIVVSSNGKVHSNLIVTCLKESLEVKRGMFVVDTPKATTIRIDTISMEIVIDSLTDLLEG